MANTNFLDSSGVDIGNILVEKSYLIDRYPELADNLRQAGIWMWGYNTVGVLGNAGPNSVYVRTPVQIAGGGNNWKVITAGAQNSFAIKTDGTLWCWGSNILGSLGLGDTVHRSSPVQLGTLSNWKQVSNGGVASSGGGNAAGIKTDGTLWTWGGNNNGDLGLGDFVHRSSPVQVGLLNDWKQISVGGTFTGAIRTNGTLWMWGYGGFGNLGNNQSGPPASSFASPIQTSTGGTDWKFVACGDNHTLALKTNGTIWTWGLNTNAQLGLSDGLLRSTPVQIGSGTDWKQISAGGNCSASIKTDGTLWTWGQNAAGQLGRNSVTNGNSPAQTVAGGTNWKQVAMNYSLLVAIKTDGTLWASGDNPGDGSTAKSSPVQIGSGTNWKLAGPGSQYASITIRDSSEDLI